MNIVFSVNGLFSMTFQHFSRFGDLLALVEDVEEAKSTRVLRQVPSRRASQAATKSSVNTARPGKRGPAEDSDTSSETSEVCCGILYYIQGEAS